MLKTFAKSYAAIYTNLGLIIKLSKFNRILVGKFC